MDKHVESITGTITLADGTKSEFSISDIGWQQWGADRERLGKTVDVLEAMTEAAAEYFEGDEEED